MMHDELRKRFENEVIKSGMSIAKLGDDSYLHIDTELVYRGFKFGLSCRERQLPNRSKDIIAWGVERNILGPNGEGTKRGQFKKTQEECLELFEAIILGEMYSDAVELAKDAIGDVYVTLVMQAERWGLTIEECIEHSWNQIKDRKGRMVNGVFVKEVEGVSSNS